MLDASKFVQAYWLAGTVASVCLAVAFRAYVRTPRRAMWWIRCCCGFRCSADALAQSRNSALRSGDVDAGGQQACRWWQSIGISAAILNNKKMAGSLESVSQGVKRVRHRGLHSGVRRFSAPGRGIC